MFFLKEMIGLKSVQFGPFNLSSFLSVLNDPSEAALQLQRLTRSDLVSYDKGLCAHCYVTEPEITQPGNSDLKYCIFVI